MNGVARISRGRLAVWVAAAALLAGCTPAALASPSPSSSVSPSPSVSSLSSLPAASPTPISPAPDSADILLRFDNGPDYAFGELTGALFMPGPEFSLYGDGTVIFRNDRANPPPVEGPIFRAQPFSTAQLTDDQVQSLLGFAVGEGGLASARGRYETSAVDDFGYTLFVIRAAGIEKRVEIIGTDGTGADELARAAFASLAEFLRSFDSSGTLPTQDWTPDRSWGVLEEAALWIEAGVLPALPDTGAAPWPWPELEPADFVYRNDKFWALEEPPIDSNTPGDFRRVMSAEEAGVLGLSHNGGVVEGIYILGPDGSTIYWLSMWPMLPDETG